MSMWKQGTVACPTCAERVRLRIAVGAHIGRAPQVRAAILARTFHRFECACGAAITIDTSFEYTDFERKQLFLVGRVAEQPAWRDHERRLHDTIERALQLGSPHASAFMHGLTSRVVFGVEALREKLVLAEAALDDGLVECIKVRAIANDLTLADPRGRLVVDAVVADTLTCRWFPTREGPAASSFDLPASWLGAALDDRASLEARFADLFRGGYVDLDRLRPA
ncbi:MAG: CpXC domain-containing protein [Kofleriaceae bacterium]